MALERPKIDTTGQMRCQSNRETLHNNIDAMVLRFETCSRIYQVLYPNINQYVPQVRCRNYLEKRISGLLYNFIALL